MPLLRLVLTKSEFSQPWNVGGIPEKFIPGTHSFFRYKVKKINVKFPIAAARPEYLDKKPDI